MDPLDQGVTVARVVEATNAALSDHTFLGFLAAVIGTRVGFALVVMFARYLRGL